LDALYESGACAGNVDESCARARLGLEHAEVRRRHKLVGALDDSAPIGRSRIEDDSAHARFSLAVSRPEGIGAASAGLRPTGYFFGSTISEPPICAGCSWHEYGKTPALSATNVMVLGSPRVTTSVMLYAGIVK